MKFIFYVIGVGGTGSLLARDLPKLLIDTKHKMCLIDGDTVELKNILRQGYQEQDIGDNKAIALSRKINSLYRINCTFMDCYINYKNLTSLLNKNGLYTPVIIGCVDNNATRIIIEKVVSELKTCIYIDSANSEYEGDIYIYAKENGVGVSKMRGQCYKLETDRHPDEVSCQEYTSKGNVQYLVTNAKMATSVLEHCNALLEHRLKVGVQVVKRFETVFYR